MAKLFTECKDLDKLFYGKFIKNDEKIRSLANANPDSYAAVLVASFDHFVTGVSMLYAHEREELHDSCFKRILKEIANSLRATEIFAVWTPSLRNTIKTMAKSVMDGERGRTSEADRDARICYGMLIATNAVEAIKFMDLCRKKYPTEIFFHRIYCYLFTSTKDWVSGLKASIEACKLFPNDANIVNARAVMLRMMTDKGDVDYTNWSRVKKQVDEVKQAFKDYLRIAPKDHRHFADNNYFVAYFAFKYAAPSSQMMRCDMEEITVYYQNGLNAEIDINPCFLPFTSEAKNFVMTNVTIHPPAHIYVDGTTCNIDMTTHGMPGRPKPNHIPTDNMTTVFMGKPSERRINVCVPHRQQLRTMLSDPASAAFAQVNCDESMDTMDHRPSNNNDSDDFEEIILYQMTMTDKPGKFTSKVMRLTVAEDSLYTENHFETIVADTTGDVIKLRLDVGVDRPSNQRLQELMKQFRFGTEWKLPNPDFYMDSRGDSTMYIRATPECMIATTNEPNAPKCRMCFKSLNPGNKCGKCKVAVYCEKDCQTKDWKYVKHSLICSEAYAKVYK